MVALIKTTCACASVNKDLRWAGGNEYVGRREGVGIKSVKVLSISGTAGGISLLVSVHFKALM